MVEMRVRWGVLGLILLALGLRLWNLHVLPPGLNYDEAFDGFDAHRIASGGYYPVYLPGNNGREPLFVYVLALFVKTLGPTAYALRLASALTGVLAIPAIYFAARGLLKDLSKGLRRASNSPFLATLPAAVAAAGIAVSYWHLSLSRLAFRAILLPVLSSLAIALFWRAWSHYRMRDYIWSAVLLSLALYTYTAARMLPAVIALFAVVELGVDLVKSRRLGRTVWAPWRARLVGLILMVVVSLLLLAPMIWTFRTTPELLSTRTSDVSVFSVPLSEMAGTPFERILHNLGAVARSFYTAGDLNPRLNLPGRPINDLVLAVLFTLGWLTCLAQIKQPWSRLVLIWLGVMLLPTVLSVEAPHSLRAVGALPPLALLYGVGAAAVLHATLWFSRRVQPRADSVRQETPDSSAARLQHLPVWAGGIVLVTVIAFSGTSTAIDYFTHWSQLAELGAEFDVDKQLAAQAATELLQRPAGDPILISSQLWVQPQMAYALGKIQPQATMPQAASVAGFRTPAMSYVHEEDPDPRQTIYLLWRDLGKVQMTRLEPLASNADATPVSIETKPVAQLRSPIHQTGWPEVTVSSLSDSIILRPRQVRYRLDVSFANGMHLVGYDIEPDTVQPGDTLSPFRLTMFWSPADAIETRNGATTNPMQGEFDEFAHLVSQGAVWQTNNGPIGGGIMLDWLDWIDAEMTVEDVRFLNASADMPPGKAHFETGLYSYRPGATSAFAERIPIVDGQGQPVADQINLASVFVGSSQPQESIADLAPLGVQFEDRIELTGWKITRDPAHPHQLLIELGWHAVDRSVIDYSAFVHLVDDTGQIITQQDGPPGGKNNPTSIWVPGETVHSTIVLDPLQETPASSYQLRIGLYEPASLRQLPVTATTNESIIGPGATYVLLQVPP